MAFRENYYLSYQLGETYGRSYPQWSLENRVGDGLDRIRAEISKQGEVVAGRMTLEAESLRASMVAERMMLAEELDELGESLIDAISESGAEVREAIDRAASYLGGRLCELQWSVERQAEETSKILRTLLASLGNESRQYWEQGELCFRVDEFTKAKWAFGRALERDVTNPFAYEYLARIAVVEDRGAEAISNLELALKFARSASYRALVMGHLARAHTAMGDLEKAAQYAAAAAREMPGKPSYAFDAAISLARVRDEKGTHLHLQKAIGQDWHYWGLGMVAETLRPARGWLEQYHEQVRAARIRRLEVACRELEELKGLLVNRRLAAERKACDAAKSGAMKAAGEGTVPEMRRAFDKARGERDEIKERALATLDELMAENAQARSRCEAEYKKKRDASLSRLSDAESELRVFLKGKDDQGGMGCWLWVLGGLALLLALIGAAMDFGNAQCSTCEPTSYMLPAKLMWILLLFGLVLYGLEWLRLRVGLSMVRKEERRLKERLSAEEERELQRLDADKAAIKVERDKLTEVTKTRPW